MDYTLVSLDGVVDEDSSASTIRNRRNADDRAMRQRSNPFCPEPNTLAGATRGSGVRLEQDKATARRRSKQGRGVVAPETTFRERLGAFLEAERARAETGSDQEQRALYKERARFVRSPEEVFWAEVVDGCWLGCEGDKDGTFLRVRPQLVERVEEIQTWLDEQKERIANCVELDAADVAALRKMHEATAWHADTPRGGPAVLEQLRSRVLGSLDAFAERGMPFNRWRERASSDSIDRVRLHLAEVALMPLVNGRGESIVHFDLEEATAAGRALDALVKRWNSPPGRRKGGGDPVGSKYAALSKMFKIAGYDEPTFSGHALKTAHLKGRKGLVVTEEDVRLSKPLLDDGSVRGWWENMHAKSMHPSTAKDAVEYNNRSMATAKKTSKRATTKAARPAAKRMGRPPKGDEPRNARLELRLSDAERAELAALAAGAGLTITDYLLAAARAYRVAPVRK